MVVSAAAVLSAAALTASSPLSDYLQQRQALVNRSQERRADAREVLRGREVAVNATIVQEIESIRARFQPPNAGFTGTLAFPGSKEAVRATRLFQWLHEMPKGALLHTHLPSMLDPSWLVANATYRPHCYIQTLPQAEQRATGGEVWPPASIAFMNASQPGSGWELASELRSKHPQGAAGFDRWLLRQLDVFANVSSFNVSLDRWVQFEPFFLRIARATSYRPVMRDYFRDALLTAARDWKVGYVEVRCCSEKDTMYDLSGQYSRREMLQELSAAVEDAKRMLPAGSFFGAQLIHSEIRSASVDTVADSLALAITERKEFPDLVAGFDLVGEEDKGKRLREFAAQLIDAQASAAASGIDLPYFFHAGETDWNGAQTTGDNVIDAALLSARIGHGIAFAKQPTAAELFSSRGGLVEVCPVSNQLLEYVLDQRMHPGATLMSLGVDVSINNDDPALLGTVDSLGYDWFMAVASWGHVDLRTIKAMCRASITHSRLADPVKQQLLTRWEADFARWVQSIPV
eukprot:TRINITY_DN165_c0_g3_i2.p1 TRINITY_DN165_c0_g3~~TRINITY_DN165_c0_g3_i2.p1  ORF type:complete len:538 (+),score=163.10 TRINITY_DN165_c0_g3_i2:61-1614(+)